MLKNTENSYGLVSRILHWLIGIMILVLLIVGFIMVDMDISDKKWEIYATHKAVGFILLLLVGLRIVWRVMDTKVLPPADLPNKFKEAGYVTHTILYLLMFIMPISGVFMSILSGHNIDVFGFFTIEALTNDPKISKIFWNIHGYTAFIFVGIIALHFLAAMYHHFIRKDNVLIRMIKS